MVKFNHSSVYPCYLKNCAGFFVLLVYTVVYLVPTCGVGYFLDVVQNEEVLRKYSNLNVGGNLWILFLVSGVKVCGKIEGEKCW